MIISPPFLSNPDIPVYDEQCVRDVMPGGIVGSGAFPISQAMAWHGGIHITAPHADEPVRAIADGIVILRRDGGSAEYEGQAHSTGCVVIRHTTEIGATTGPNGPTAVEVTYYSIYQHLRTLDPALPALNKPIYRKDKLGLAGTIHDKANRIHLEIIAGDADTQKLINRSAAELPLNSDGRRDTVYGQLYILLPANSTCHADQPGNATLPAASGDSGDAKLIVGIQYQQGHATLTTYRLSGEIVGSADAEDNAEYNLYTEANKRHSALNAHERAHSSPSGWYELLRFGRNLGPDPLPANAAHWRKVVLPDHPQGAWVNLNAAGTYKFSDADFPHWTGWKLINDDIEDNNSQCNSALIDAMLSPAAQPKAAPAGPPSLSGPATLPPQPAETAQTTPQQKAANRQQNLCKPAMQEKLARTVCKFPTEWSKNDVKTRWEWVKAQGNPYLPHPLNADQFNKMVAFAEKLCFWEELPPEDKNRLTLTHWHFHPREFILHFRKCGWLSEEELSQTFPRYFFYEASGGRYIAHKAGSPSIYQINTAQAKERIRDYRIPLNTVMRKYLISGPQRITMFLAQALLETDRWRTMEEYGFGAENEKIPMAKYYAAFYGRGVMQLTWAGNYDSYGKYRSTQALPEVSSGRYNDRIQRISTASTHYFSDPTLRDKKGKIIGISGTPRIWYPRYDPSTLKNDSYAACDSGGFYWVSRSVGNNNININRFCDRVFDEESIRRINILVNGGGNGYFDRQAYSRFIFRILSDSYDNELSKEYGTPRGPIVVDFNMAH